MFTGIVEELGVVRKIERSGEKIRILVGAELVLEDVKLGDSIATNGVCLTVTSFGSDFFTADMMESTAKKSGLDKLSLGSQVNLERALMPMSRLGGHILQGHIDCIGFVNDILPKDSGYLMEVAVDPEYYPLMVDQGSIGLNGVSLTIYKITDKGPVVSLIPETLARTNLMQLKKGMKITVEFDILGKYVQRNLFNPYSTKKEEKKEIDKEFLSKYGF